MGSTLMPGVGAKELSRRRRRDWDQRSRVRCNGDRTGRGNRQDRDCKARILGEGEKNLRVRGCFEI